jgi:hypothetical protein
MNDGKRDTREKKAITLREMPISQQVLSVAVSLDEINLHAALKS